MKTNTKNKVLLITTRGCAGCSIAKKLITEAIQMYGADNITFEEYDISAIDKKFIKTNNITDFPSVILMKNDNVMFKFTGTKPSIVIHRWFKVNFG